MTITRGGTELGTGSLEALVGQVTGRPRPDAGVDREGDQGRPRPGSRELVGLIGARSSSPRCGGTPGRRSPGSGSMGRLDPDRPAGRTGRDDPAQRRRDRVDHVAGPAATRLRGTCKVWFRPASSTGRCSPPATAHASSSCVPKGATRAEVELAGGGTLRGAAARRRGMVVPGAKPLSVRAYDADGTGGRQGRTAPGKGVHGRRRAVPVTSSRGTRRGEVRQDRGSCASSWSGPVSSG